MRWKLISDLVFGAGQNLANADLTMWEIPPMIVLWKS